MKFFTMLLCILCMGFSFSAEIDHYNISLTDLTDELSQVNRKTNKLFQEALQEANERGDCSEKRLYRYLGKRFKNHVVDEFAKWLYKTDDVDKVGQKVKDTIYGDLKWHQSIVLGFLYRVNRKPMGYMVRLGDDLYGVDKFEHFMSKGHKFFDWYYHDGKSLDEILEYSEKTERGLMGAVTTGVYAYADLAANFNGMRFWNHVLAKYNDILGKKYNYGPYVKCQGQKWVQVLRFDWKFYLDQSFSEGHNCSKFRTQKITDSVKSRLEQFTRRDGQIYSCPMKDVKKNALLIKYAPVGHSILNLEGHDTLPKEERKKRKFKWSHHHKKGFGRR